MKLRLYEGLDDTCTKVCRWVKLCLYKGWYETCTKVYKCSLHEHSCVRKFGLHLYEGVYEWSLCEDSPDRMHKCTCTKVCERSLGEGSHDTCTKVYDEACMKTLLLEDLGRVVEGSWIHFHQLPPKTNWRIPRILFLWTMPKSKCRWTMPQSSNWRYG